VAGDARAVSGVPNAAQQVQFKVRATAFASGGGIPAAGVDTALASGRTGMVK
jgi:hypothetical protein